MKETVAGTAGADSVFVDARTVTDGEVVEADVCVAGGGVAGLVTALELEPAGVRVALVEHGESLEDAEVEGSYPPLGSTRAGGLGGTAALWTAELAPGQVGARYAPLAPIDFEAREGMPWSGWPFGRSHLEPFYTRAQELCGAGPFDYAATPQNGDVADAAFSHGPRTVFTRDCPARVAQSDSIRAFVAAKACRTAASSSSLRRTTTLPASCVGWATSRRPRTGASLAPSLRSPRPRAWRPGRRSSTPSGSALCRAGRGSAGLRRPSTSTTWSSSGRSASGGWSSDRAATSSAAPWRACAGSSPTESSRPSTGPRSSSGAPWRKPVWAG